MDRPRHPQVIRPWKAQQTQKQKSRLALSAQLPREHTRKPSSRKRGNPSTSE